MPKSKLKVSGSLSLKRGCTKTWTLVLRTYTEECYKFQKDQIMENFFYGKFHFLTFMGLNRKSWSDNIKKRNHVQTVKVPMIFTNYFLNSTQQSSICTRSTKEKLGRRCEMCSKLTIKTPKQRQWREPGSTSILLGWEFSRMYFRQN